MTDCDHPRSERGKDAPLMWGSYRTQVCLICGAFRLRGHGVGLFGPIKSEWRPKSEYAEATSKREDDE